MKKKLLFLILLVIIGSMSTLSAEVIENVKVDIGNLEYTYTLFDTLDELNSFLEKRGLSFLYFMQQAYWDEHHNSATSGVTEPNNSLSPNVINAMKRYNKKISYTYYQRGSIDFYTINIHDSEYGSFYRTYTINGL
jgi:hypothetical protein